MGKWLTPENKQEGSFKFLIKIAKYTDFTHDFLSYI